MNIVELAAVLTAATAVFSAWWSFRTWRTNRTKEKVGRFRTDLSLFRSAADLFESGISDTLSIEVGSHAAHFLIDHGKMDTGKELKDFVRSCDKEETFIACLMYGFKESDLYDKASDSTVKMRSVSGYYNEQFPVTNRLLDTISRFCAKSLNIDAFSLFMKNIVSDDSAMTRTLYQNIEDDDTIQVARSKLSDFFSSVISTRLQSLVDPNKSAVKISYVVIGAYLSKSDDELAAASLYEVSKMNDISKVDNYLWTDDINEFSGML